jgi:hypothetical protein
MGMAGAMRRSGPRLGPRARELLEALRVGEVRYPDPATHALDDDRR